MKDKCKSGASTAGFAAGQTVCIHFDQLRLLSVNTWISRKLRSSRNLQILIISYGGR